MKMKNLLVLLLTFLFTLNFCPAAFAADGAAVKNAIDDTAAFLLKTVKKPTVSAVGGEWTIIGLARSDYNVPQSYYDGYYQTVEQTVKSLEGKLHDKEYTDYSRVVIALTAIGKDPSNVGGYNLLTPLGDFEKTIWQGINGPIFALLALDSGNYEIPQNPEAKTQKPKHRPYGKCILMKYWQDSYQTAAFPFLALQPIRT